MKWKGCALWRCLKDPTLHLFPVAVAGKSSAYPRYFFLFVFSGMLII